MEHQRQKLTPQQVRTITEIANGKSFPEAAEAMGISIKTVSTHMTTAMNKVGCSNRVGLVHYAIQHGLVTMMDFPRVH